MLGSRHGQLDTCTPNGSFQAWVFKAPLGTELRNCPLGCAYSGNISKSPPFQSSVETTSGKKLQYFYVSVSMSVT